MTLSSSASRFSRITHHVSQHQYVKDLLPTEIGPSIAIIEDPLKIVFARERKNALILGPSFQALTTYQPSTINLKPTKSA